MSKTFDQYSNPLEVLFYCAQQARNAEKLEGRRIYPTLAIVSNNQDPENRRRIKVLDPAVGAKVESNWIRPLRVTQNSDPPLPQINQMVMLLFADGDDNKAFYLPIMNDTNPSLVKSDAVLDHAETVEGNRSLSVQKNNSESFSGNNTVLVSGNDSETISGTSTKVISGDISETAHGFESHRVDKALTINCGQSISLTTDSGASITLTTTGQIIFQDAAGHKITLGGSGGTNTWDLAGSSLQILNASDFKVGGKSIATVTAPVSGGQVTARGW